MQRDQEQRDQEQRELKKLVANNNEIESKCTTLKAEATKEDNFSKRLNDDTSQMTHSNTMPLRRKEGTANKLSNSIRKSKHDRCCVKTTHDKDQNDLGAEAMTAKTKSNRIRK